ncbi:integrase core domain-containing protein [Pandoraea sp. B-6]|uniref:integrase core domain-containing protein n=1 Tax=Pandoraea sp. B-6 TaxID=1204340 RepID=UPI0035109974
MGRYRQILDSPSRLATPQHASRVIGDRIQFYNHRRPRQALKMMTPAEAFALAA